MNLELDPLTEISFTLLLHNSAGDSRFSTNDSSFSTVVLTIYRYCLVSGPIALRRSWAGSRWVRL